MNTEHFHNVPLDDYARLVALFGETDNADTVHPGDTVTRWVRFGAGSVTLVFFPERVPEPVVSDPDAWAAVAADAKASEPGWNR